MTLYELPKDPLLPLFRLDDTPQDVALFSYNGDGA